MVEVDVQFLAGVAVTVFLALLFFGVVVLWDVALALRSVGDKIDKLEDNVDDDLKDIGYSLSNISNAPGGGTQLHLGGGTISSGPATNQHAQQQGESPHHGHTAGAQPRQDNPSRPTDPTNQQQPPQPGSPGFDEQPQGDEAVGSDPAEVDEERDTDHRGDESAVADESVDDSTDETAESDESTTPTDTDVEHPRASINRGRFIASPDRTPWYATPLDREAIDNAGPVIAGALEAGEYEGETEGDEVDVVAVGPAAEAGNTDEDPIVATAPTTAHSSESGDENEHEDDEDGYEAELSGAVGEAGAVDAGVGVDVTVEADTDVDVDAGSEDTSNDERPGEDVDGRSADEESNTFTFTTEDSSESDTAEVDGDEDSTNSLEIEYRDEDDDLEVEASEADEASEESGVVDTVTADDEPEQTDPVEETPGVDGHVGGEREDVVEVAESEETEEADEAHERELSIDEAIDAMNDDSPVLSLSSYGFDVTAESDDDGAVLRFEFDPDTIEISGPTKRLLRYQLRSFAERESTPEGEVTVDGNSIVVDLPDASGDAVSKWGEGTVSIIDRTLYLSDNSN